MADLALTIAHRIARNRASIALADAGEGNSAMRLYTQAGGVLLAIVPLQKPCGVVAPENGRIQLAPDLSAAPLCVATGAAGWGEWVNGDGTPIAAGSVAAAGSGADACFYIVGTVSGTPQIFAGGTISLSSLTVG